MYIIKSEHPIVAVIWLCKGTGPTWYHVKSIQTEGQLQLGLEQCDLFAVRQEH